MQRAGDPGAGEAEEVGVGQSGSLSPLSGGLTGPLRAGGWLRAACSPPTGELLVTPDVRFSCCCPLSREQSAKVLSLSLGPSLAYLTSLYVDKRLFACEELKIWALDSESPSSKPRSATRASYSQCLNCNCK